MDAILGRKLGMTRVYNDDGRVVPVTVIEAGPCPVVQVRSRDDGAQGVQLGLGARKAKRTSKAMAGHVAPSGLEAVPAKLQEFALPAGGEVPALGDKITVEIFAVGDTVKITGTTKGRGFQGVVKRYGF
ncbi:MAG: 50S ribosomal protein L3, partial [Gemmatimonadota bacterium]|nr:50S ribosomal protein L3 [Gemmatimonadota bacterium]